MKRRVISLLVLGAMVLAPAAFATPCLSIFVDAAPNGFGSPDFEPWRDAAYAGAADGSFVNMLSSYNPANIGTTDFEIQDEVVYSFGDLGKRLTWIYWLPDETLADLTGTGRFEIALMNR